VTRRKTTIRTHVLQLLSDGKARRSDEIETAMEQQGFSRKSVGNVLAFFANHRCIERTWDGPRRVYRRLDVEHAA